MFAATSSVFKILHQQLFLDIVKMLSDDPSGCNIRINESEERLSGQRMKIRIIFLSTGCTALIDKIMMGCMREHFYITNFSI